MTDAEKIMLLSLVTNWGATATAHMQTAEALEANQAKANDLEGMIKARDHLSRSIVYNQCATQLMVLVNKIDMS